MGVLSTIGRVGGAAARATAKAAKSSNVKEFAKNAMLGTVKKAWEYSGANDIDALRGTVEIGKGLVGGKPKDKAPPSKPSTSAQPQLPPIERSGGDLANEFLGAPPKALPPPSPPQLPNAKLETEKIVRVMTDEGAKQRRVMSDETRAKISATKIANAQAKKVAEAQTAIKQDTQAIEDAVIKSETLLTSIADSVEVLADSQRKADSVFARKDKKADGSGGGGGSSGILGGLAGLAGTWAAGKVGGKIAGRFPGLAKTASKIPGLGGLVSKIPGVGGFAAGALASATGGDLLDAVTEVDKPGKPATTVPDAGKAASKGAGKAAGKGLGKAFIKKIPVIGALAGLGFGASRAFAGDFAGAGMEVASGLAGTVPGLGTAASIGIDAALIARDMQEGDKPVEAVDPENVQPSEKKATIPAQTAETTPPKFTPPNPNLPLREEDGSASLFSALTEEMTNEDKGIFVKPAKDPFGSDSLFGEESTPGLSKAGGGGEVPAAVVSPAQQSAVGATPPPAQASAIPQSGRTTSLSRGGLQPNTAASIGTTTRPSTPQVQMKPAVGSTSVKPANTRGKKFEGFGDDVDGYIAEASQKYGISEDVLRGFVKMEAGWTGQMSPTGAIGTGQFIQPTWDGLAATKEGQEIGMTKIGKRFRTAEDPRFDKKTNTLATGLLAKQNADALRQAGLEPTGENLYMMHNIGPGVIPALQGKSVSGKTLEAMKHNGMKEGQTAAEFVAMQKSRFNSHYAQANAPEVLAKAPNSGARPDSVEAKAAPSLPDASPSQVNPPAVKSAAIQAETLTAETKQAEERRGQAAPVVIAAGGGGGQAAAPRQPSAGPSKAPLLVRNNESSIARVADNMISRTMS